MGPPGDRGAAGPAGPTGPAGKDVSIYVCVCTCVMSAHTFVAFVRSMHVYVISSVYDCLKALFGLQLYCCVMIVLGMWHVLCGYHDISVYFLNLYFFCWHSGINMDLHILRFGVVSLDWGCLNKKHTFLSIYSLISSGQPRT